MVSIIQKPTTMLNDIKNNTDPADKACKVVTNAVKLADKAINVSGGSQVWEPISKFAGQLNVFNGLVGAFNFINRANEFVSPARMMQGKKVVSDYRWKCWKKCSGKAVEGSKDFDKNKNVFKDDGYWSVTKLVSQIFLTIAHSVAFVQFWEVLGLVAYGAASSFLGLAKNILYIPAATFGIIAGGISLSESKHHVNNVARKIHNWQDKLGGENGEDFKKADLLKHYDVKLQARKVELKETTDTKAQAALQAKINKYTQFITDINNVTDGDKLSEDTKFHKYCTVKLEGWGKNLETAKVNKGKTQTKTWLGIANQVGKLAFGILAIVGFAVGIATNPWFVLALSAGWVATHTLGLTKWLYGNYNKVADIKAPTPNIAFDKA